MSILKHSQIYRGGETARNLTPESVDVTVARNYSSLEGIKLSFSLASKGGGTTKVEIRIGSKDFPAIISEMMRGDGKQRQISMEAMANLLAQEISKQPRYDGINEYVGRKSVVSAAENAYKNAPEPYKPAEELTLKKVKKLVDDFNVKS